MDLFETLHTVVDIMKMCMWALDEARINFERITAFCTLLFQAKCCIVEYGVCVINSSYNFQLIFLKPNMIILKIMKMCL